VLLPCYAGQVKCIHVDPPFNTGQAFEHYDDNLERSIWLGITGHLPPTRPEVPIQLPLSVCDHNRIADDGEQGVHPKPSASETEKSEA